MHYTRMEDDSVYNGHLIIIFFSSLRKLGAQEVEKMAVQSKRQEAMEKASLAEQERERER